jgi:hypothetical protein
MASLQASYINCFEKEVPSELNIFNICSCCLTNEGDGNDRKMTYCNCGSWGYYEISIRLRAPFIVNISFEQNSTNPRSVQFNTFEKALYFAFGKRKRYFTDQCDANYEKRELQMNEDALGYSDHDYSIEMSYRNW